MFKTRNKYIRFLANGVIFLAFIFTIDLILGNTLRHFYFKQKSGFNYHQIYSMDSTEAGVIILGSSRACRHYIPAIIEDSLGITCFNTGIDGNSMFNSYCVYKSIVERYTPEVVLMDLNQSEIFKGTESYVQLASLLPYYRINNEVKNVIHLKSKFEKFKLLSRIYPFNSSLLAIGTGIVKSEDLNENRGYMPLFGNLSDSSLTYVQEIHDEIDTNKTKALEAIATDCNKRQIRLVFIQSPKYRKVDQGESISAIKELTDKEGVEFWNYVNDTTFLKPKYFKDAVHMNNAGATEFTRTIAGRIKREIVNDVLIPEGYSK